MGFGTKTNLSTGKKLPKRKVAGLEDQALSSSTEAAPLPVLAGEQLIAVTWISRVYNHRAEKADDNLPSGKK